MTPGAIFLSWLVATVGLPLLAAHYGLKLASSYFNFYIPAWIHVSICLFTVPAVPFAKSFYTHIHEEREIARLGAVRVPELRGKGWPGNLDLVFSRLKAGKDGYPADVMDGLTKKYGKIVNMKILGKNRIITSDPEHMRSILALNVQNWEKGSYFRRMVASVLGSGVFNVDGELWKFHRSTTKPFFSRDRVTDFQIFERNTLEAVSIIIDCQDAFDFQNLIRRFTLDVTMEFLFGMRVHAMQWLKAADSDETESEDRKRLQEFDHAFFAVQHQLAQRSRRVPIWPLFEIKSDITSRDMRIVRNFLEPVINAALDRQQRVSALKADWAETSDRETLLDHLVSQTDDRQLIFDETINMLFAGRDTTTALITYVVYCLATHKTVLARLRDEIAQEIGSRQIEIADVPKMKYLKAVLNETLRLFPPVPGNARVPIESCTLPPLTPGGKPFYIPAGSNVPFSIMYMHRSKDLWGDDAEDFDPDRWLDDRLQQYFLANPFIFLPFNAGPRMCLGQQFALHETSYFIATLLQTFDDIELAEDAMPPEAKPPAAWAKGPGRKMMGKIRPRSEFTLSIEGGLWVRFRKLSDVDGRA